MYAHPRKGKEVNTTNTRIRKLRKTLDLTQQAFADRLNIKRNTVATYEAGKSNPSDAAINLICREFNVSEEWLRTGEGEMFRELSRDQELANFFGDVLRGESDDFRKRFISMLSRLDTTDWEALERMAEKLIAEARAEPEKPIPARPWWDTPEEDAPPWDTPHVPPGYSSRAEMEAEARAEAEEMYHQILKEKIVEAGYSASPSDSGKPA